MARTFKLVSGTDEVDLINTADPGIIFSRGGAGNNAQGSDLEFTSSKLADGSNLRLKRYLPIAEDYVLNLKGSSHDNVASQLQTLQRILRKGDQNALTTWQQEPLYIQQQTTNETGARYSKVLAWNSIELSDYFAPPIEADSQVDDFVITLAREPFWRGTAPGVMPSAEAVKSPDFPWFDAYVGTLTNFDVTGAAAQEGDWGAAFTVGVGAEVYGIDNLPDSETTIAIEFYFDINSLTMAEAEQFFILDTVSPGTGAAFQSIILKSGSTYQIFVISKNDAGANDGVISVTLPDSPQIIRIEWVASSAPGADDGTLELFFGGVSQGSASGIDNDTHAITAVHLGPLSGIDAGTSGTFYIDRYRWDDALAPTAYERTIDFEQVTAPIPNYRQSTGVLTHIYNEDNSATGFSANLVAEPSFEWFVVSGSTPAANDVIYFGADEPFYNLVFNFKAGSDVSIAYDMEFSDGASGWITMEGFKPNSLGYTGQMIWNWGGDPAWGTDTVNAIAAKYWVRIKLTTVTTWTTSPEQADQIVFTANSPYLEFNNLQVHGDVPALMLQRLISYTTTDSAVPQDPEANPITNVIMGMKSRGLSTFVSRLNCGGDVPTNWTANVGANTTQVAKESSPGGNVALVAISSGIAMANRMKFTLDVAAQDPNDWEGTYRIYARARQNGGAVGDVKLRYKYSAFSETVGETITMVDTDKDEILDLGDLSILPFGTLGDESAGALLFSIAIEASSESTGVTSLELYDLVLMPIDEMFFHAGWSGKTNQYIQGTIVLKSDAGILREGSILEYRPALTVPEEFKPFFTWQMKSPLPMLEPRKNARLYYLYWEDNQVPGTNISNQGQALGARSYLHERWITLRGSD